MDKNNKIHMNMKLITIREHGYWLLTIDTYSSSFLYKDRPWKVKINEQLAAKLAFHMNTVNERDI